MYQPDFPDMPAPFGVEIARAARLVDVAATSPMIDRCTSASLRAFVLRLVTSAGVSVACTMMPYQDCVSALPSSDCVISRPVPKKRQRYPVLGDLDRKVVGEGK